MRQPSDVAVLTGMPFWGGLTYFLGHLVPSGSIYGESRFIRSVIGEINFIEELGLPRIPGAVACAATRARRERLVAWGS